MARGRAGRPTIADVPQVVDGDQLGQVVIDDAVVGVGPADMLTGEPVVNADAAPGEVFYEQRLSSGEPGVSMLNVSGSKVRWQGQPVSPFVRVWRTGAGAGDAVGVRGQVAIVPRVSLLKALNKRVNGQPVFSLQRISRAETPIACRYGERLGCKKRFRNETQELMHAKKKHPVLFGAETERGDEVQIQALRSLADAAQQQTAMLATQLEQQNQLMLSMAARFEASSAGDEPVQRRGRRALDIVPREAATV